MKKLLFVIMFFVLKNGFGQLRENFSTQQSDFLNKELKRFKIYDKLNVQNHDSAIVIHYKSALYLLVKHNDSLTITQNIVVDKINNPQERKLAKRFIKSRIIYNDIIDSSIINEFTFSSLFNLGKLSFLNNVNIKSTTITKNTNSNDFYAMMYSNGIKNDEFKINAFWINDPSIIVNGWHIKRLILQLYLDFDHWLIVDKVIKESGKGYYILNNYIENTTTFFYDGNGNFIEYYSKFKWNGFFPAQFVLPDKSKPKNKYPILPVLPKGAKFIES